jgi:hypothetical protein
MAEYSAGFRNSWSFGILNTCRFWALCVYWFIPGILSINRVSLQIGFFKSWKCSWTRFYLPIYLEHTQSEALTELWLLSSNCKESLSTECVCPQIKLPACRSSDKKNPPPRWINLRHRHTLFLRCIVVLRIRLFPFRMQGKKDSGSRIQIRIKM